MNRKDRERLVKLRELLVSVPYPQDGSGAPSQSISGFVAYQNDMRNLLPVVNEIIKGMLCEEIPTLELDWDYQDPDKLIHDLTAWIEKRKRESWCGIPAYDFRTFQRTRSAA